MTKQIVRYDPLTQEGLILLHGDNRRGVWSAQSQLRGRKTTRFAGQLPTTASKHTLQAVALTAALRNIDRFTISQLIDNGLRTKKPRLLVVSRDQSFVDGITALISRRKTDKPLRAGRNFWSVLAQQIARFDLSFVAEPNSKGNAILQDWARRVIFDRKELLNVPDVLSADAVSEILFA